VCAPKSPAHVKVVGATVSSLTIAWRAPADATDYVVQVGSRSGRTKGTQLTVAGLHCGKRYTVVVRAVGPGGKSPPVAIAGRTRHC
jgi:chitodextrinase